MPIITISVLAFGLSGAATAAAAVAREWWNTSQAEITPRTDAFAESLDEPAGPRVDGVLTEIEATDSAALVGALAGECYYGNAVPGRRATRMSAFYRHWIALVRLEFPLRANRPSDKAAMSKWLAGKMRERGIRPAHMADAIPKVVAIAINPSRAEIEAEQMADAAMVRTNGGRLRRRIRKAVRKWLGPLPEEARTAPPGFN